MGVRFLIILYLLFISSAHLTAQLLGPEKITIEQGLSQGMIYDILQSRDGFLWVATKDGLNRYDGYNFKTYINSIFDPYSLVENTVTMLFEDSRGWLWVGTESKGLDVFIPQTGRFYHFPLSLHHTGNAQVFEVHGILESPDGAIWVLQRGSGLARIPIPDAWKTKGLPEDPNLASLCRPTQVYLPLVYPESERISGLGIYNGQILVASEFQYYVIDIAGTNPIRIQISDQQIYPTGFNFGTKKSADEIWGISPSGAFRIKNGTFTNFPAPGNEKVERGTVETDADGNIWLLLNKRIWQLAPGEDLDYSKPDWEMDEIPTCLTTDRNHNIWLGTLGYGLRKFNPRKKLFHSGAAGTTVWGLWRDTKGRYYCNVVNKIYPFDPVSGKIGTSTAFPQATPRLLDMLVDPSGAIWLLGRDEVHDDLAYLQYQSADEKTFKTITCNLSMYVYANMMRDHTGNIWFTGGNCQLAWYKPDADRIDILDYGQLFGEKANSVRAIDLVEDGSGTIWIGTQQGLVKGIPNGQSYSFQLIKADPSQPNGLSDNNISCLLPDAQDPSGILWIGTKGNGINRLDLHSGRIEHIINGLPNKVIYGILPGSNGDLWCSTNRGLAKLSPREQTPPFFDITTFTAAKGLQDNEFNTQSYYKAHNGELMFGGVNGLNHFFPEEIALDTIPPPVFIIGLEINHRPVTKGDENSPVKVPLEQLRSLRLDYDQNNLSFEFAALDFTDPAHNRYRYRLDGLDVDWVETGAYHFAHFTHLAPGDYEFHVQGSNGEGNWHELSAPIIVTVDPPWWRNGFAYLFYVMLLAVAGWQAYLFQIRRVKLREQLAFEHRETERIKALERMKTNFFSNVTHEFRTPLTLILEPIRQLIQKPQDTMLMEKLGLVERNSKRLLGLVNQLLDLAKLEHGGMKPDLHAGDLAHTVHNSFLPFLALAEKKNISLRFEGPKNAVQGFFDHYKVELVVNNLLSNALKFTNEGGRIDCVLKLETRNTVRFAQIEVKDNGIGISKENRARVFERYYQIDSAQTRAGVGTGIGLALSKELAELIGGGINLESEVGVGSQFIFWFPLPESTQSESTAQASEVIDLAYQDIKMPDIKEDSDAPVVLVIDDNRDIRDLIRLSLSGHWQVIETSNGAEGVQKAAELIPDLVITDLMMPVKDGFEVCNDLKTNELTAHIPVILLTAKAGMDSKLQGLRIGADDYLTKPFHTAELLARMQNLVENRRRLRQLFGSNSTQPENEFIDKPFLTAPDNEFLRRFNLMIESNLGDETLGVEEFSGKMLISRVQLHRKLKALTGQSATDFIRDYRLNRAYAMLKNKEGLVVDIAARVGFINEKYFSTVFKEKFGVSPSQV
jgi:signal transduction histidine kinase/DNA-binding response OmpR family regulator/ligand-binding sensor domain-containing protein